MLRAEVKCGPSADQAGEEGTASAGDGRSRIAAATRRADAAYVGSASSRGTCAAALPDDRPPLDSESGSHRRDMLAVDDLIEA